MLLSSDWVLLVSRIFCTFQVRRQRPTKSPFRPVFHAHWFPFQDISFCRGDGLFLLLGEVRQKHRARNLILSVICAAAVHGLFDYLLMIEEFLSSGLATVIFIVFILGDIKLWKLGIKFIRKQQQLTQNQNITSDEEYAQAEIPVTENEEPEYKSIDWNAGEKTTN